jgi:hypothetical protein
MHLGIIKNHKLYHFVLQVHIFVCPKDMASLSYIALPKGCP